MNTNNTSKLISVVQDILKQHDYSFDITGPTTFNLDGWPLNMCPVLEFMEDGMSLACPIAYYVTDEQRDLILDSCRNNKMKIHTKSHKTKLSYTVKKISNDMDKLIAKRERNRLSNEKTIGK